MTTSNISRHGTSWVLSTDQNNLYRSLTANRTVASPGATSFAAPISINGLTAEASDWAVACVYVFNRTLTASEYLFMEDFLASRYYLPVPIQTGLVVSLDASDYVSGSTTWNDRTANGYNFTLSSTAAYNNTQTTYAFPYFDFNSQVATRATEVPYTTYMTMILFTTLNNSTASYRTLTRGPDNANGGDHHVIVNTGTNNLGLWINPSVGFVPYDTNVDVSTLSQVYTRFNMWVFIMSTQAPYYIFYYNPSSTPLTPRGQIATNTNAIFNTGIVVLGGTSGNIQNWGNIGTFLLYHRRLSEEELVNTYNRYKKKYNLP
jgi:hypothetical protein